MKKFKIITFSVLTLSIVGSTGLFGFDFGAMFGAPKASPPADQQAQVLGKQLDLGKLLEKGKEFAAKINFSGNPQATLESIRAGAEVAIATLPTELLGINIEQLKSGHISEDILRALPTTLNEAISKLTLINKFLSPQARPSTFFLMNMMLVPQLKPPLKDIATTALSLAEKNLAFVDQIASLLQLMETKLKDLQQQDLNNPAVIATAFTDLKSTFDSEYLKVYDSARSFIEANAAALGTMLQQVAAIDLSAVKPTLELIQKFLK